jgi:hypothetical protein
MFKNVSSKLCLLLDNVEKFSRARKIGDDKIIQSMHNACWITKTTETHSEYVALFACPRQKLLHERAP